MFWPSLHQYTFFTAYVCNFLTTSIANTSSFPLLLFNLWIKKLLLHLHNGIIYAAICKNEVMTFCLFINEHGKYAEWNETEDRNKHRVNTLILYIHICICKDILPSRDGNIDESQEDWFMVRSLTQRTREGS